LQRYRIRFSPVAPDVAAASPAIQVIPAGQGFLACSRAREVVCSDQCSIASPVEQAHFERMQASDSRAGFAVETVDLRRRTGARAAFAMHAAANGTIREYLYITETCAEVLRRSACYLCNTHRKRGCASLFEAVPLLRVQNASVIVTVRRRGASRGRPVLGGSLKSLALAGVSEGAKRLSGESRDKGTNLRVTSPSGSGTFPLEQLGGLT